MTDNSKSAQVKRTLFQYSNTHQVMECNEVAGSDVESACVRAHNGLPSHRSKRESLVESSEMSK